MSNKERLERKENPKDTGTLRHKMKAPVYNKQYKPQTCKRGWMRLGLHGSGSESRQGTWASLAPRHHGEFKCPKSGKTQSQCSVWDREGQGSPTQAKRRKEGSACCPDLHSPGAAFWGRPSTQARLWSQVLGNAGPDSDQIGHLTSQPQRQTWF